jgi:hypothetical protein
MFIAFVASAAIIGVKPLLYECLCLPAPFFKIGNAPAPDLMMEHTPGLTKLFPLNDFS